MITKTYNAQKDPNNEDERILFLRKQHEDMDRAVLTAYGWNEIAVPPYSALSDEDRAAQQALEDEVIDRLFVLNAQRAEEPKKAAAKKETEAEASGEAPKRGQKKKDEGQGNWGFDGAGQAPLKS